MLKKMIDIKHILNNGEIILYPTESIFGLGCDPHNFNAVKKLFYLKKRSFEKKFILLTGDFFQFERYVNFNLLNKKKINFIFNNIDNHISWIVPASNYVPKYLLDNNKCIAIRFTNRYIIKKICYVFKKPIITTSANISGERYYNDVNKINTIFKDNIYHVYGDLGTNNRPSIIYNIINNKKIR